ncbi:hypothetical protein HDU96_006318 [Phlyctochytrium bullatum]|nr:hypothetical protein HDU96_006318 [Phlyctochytrium bullatum]
MVERTHSKADNLQAKIMWYPELESVKVFLREFFCEDHGPCTINTRVVMMNSEEPSDEFKNLIEDPL